MATYSHVFVALDSVPHVARSVGEVLGIELELDRDAPFVVFRGLTDAAEYSVTNNTFVDDLGISFSEYEVIATVATWGPPKTRDRERIAAATHLFKALRIRGKHGLMVVDGIGTLLDRFEPKR